MIPLSILKILAQITNVMGIMNTHSPLNGINVCVLYMDISHTSNYLIEK